MVGWGGSERCGLGSNTTVAIATQHSSQERCTTSRLSAQAQSVPGPGWKGRFKLFRQQRGHQGSQAEHRQYIQHSECSIRVQHRETLEIVNILLED